MTTLYKRHDVTTIAEVNALALSDRQQNDAIVLSDAGHACAWSLPYKTRNEGVGRWEYDYDGVSHDYLEDGDKITVLVPTEAEEEWALIYDSEDPTPCIDEVDAREWSRIDGEGQAPARRLVTPWEEVAS